MMQNNLLIKQPLVGHVYGTATSTTHAVFSLPAEWRGQKVIIQSIGANLFLTCGTSASIEADRAAVSSGTPPALTVDNTTCMYIPEDTGIELQFDALTTHFAVEADADGQWRGWLSGF